MAGSSSPGQNGVYGEKNVSSTSNNPGARFLPALHFNQASRELWLFGGYGHPEYGIGQLNDLWRLSFFPGPPADLITYAIPSVPPNTVPSPSPTLQAPPLTTPQQESVPSGSSPVEQSTRPSPVQKIATQTDETSTNTVGTTVGAVVGVAGGAGVIALAAVFIWRRRKSRHSEDNAKHTKVDEEKDSDDEYTALSDQQAPVGHRAVDSKSSELKEFKEEWMIPFDELQLKKKIGQGAFGIVFSGRWRNAKVAIKQAKAFCLDEDAMDEFKREALLQLNLRPHPNCVQTLGFSNHNSSMYVVMEWCRMGSLETLIKSGTLTLDDKLHIILGMTSGLLHLHKSGIVHRDIAARNILVGEGQVAKISDFGMSRMLDKFETAGTTNSNIGPVRVR